MTFSVSSERQRLLVLEDGTPNNSVSSGYMLTGADPGGLRGLNSEDPTKAPGCHNNLFTITNCERFKCDGGVLERNDS